MKIKKFDQSCLLIETKGKRILIDPGNINYTEERLTTDWTNIDAILVTHKHIDHCYAPAIKTICKTNQCHVYTSKEVQEQYKFPEAIIVKAGDEFPLGDEIKIEVTKAVHGFLTTMKYKGGEIKENIGFMVDDGENRLYATSDTINFNHNYQCDILCMPFNGHGLTVGIPDGVDFAKDLNPSLVIPVHTQHKLYNPDLVQLAAELEEENLEYEIIEVGEEIEVE